MSELSPKEVIELLTEDVQKHREYIQKLYRNAAITASVAIVLGGGAVLFVTDAYSGDREHRFWYGEHRDVPRIGSDGFLAQVFTMGQISGGFSHGFAL